MMYLSIKLYVDELKTHFPQISPERKQLLEKISKYLKGRLNKDLPISLIYICTHNSRRSHFGQIWSKVASEYYKINNIQTYSGGTEATAFNRNAINALKRIGFKISTNAESQNSEYKVCYDESRDPIICFSKVYDHPNNPQKDFAAIMTCSDAEENCPFIPGAELRIATNYDDPKAFDDTPLQDSKYDERCKQIALETFYVFSLIK